MPHAYYHDSIKNFVTQSSEQILGELAKSNQFSLDDLQRNAWQNEICILKNELAQIEDGYIAIEYTIPRIGRRVDCVIIYKGLVFLLEFKTGANKFLRADIDQVTDYALDLQNFHKESRNCILVPVLVATEARNVLFLNDWQKERILNVQLCNKLNIREVIEGVSQKCAAQTLIDPVKWINSAYKPTPTIIEAAQALYSKHNVKDISRNEAYVKNLTSTTDAIKNIIKESKQNRRKTICFITGVPGAGKTLAGLNIANECQHLEEDEHAVFLSGNHPLVCVLQEALARDDASRNKYPKARALEKAKVFIQNIHHFRDDAIEHNNPPHEKVIIFDEAQRAWNSEQLQSFMLKKKAKQNFSMSEPEFLLGVMDRHQDWSTIICLIGGGQEINTGEGGLLEWFVSLKEHFPHWQIFLSDQITDYEYIQKQNLSDLLTDMSCKVIPDLHLSVSLRSFRAEKVSDFVKSLLDMDICAAQQLYNIIHEKYPILITRNLEQAKAWVRKSACGSERYGLITSSKAKRLRSLGICVQSKIESKHWFLNDKNDVRSSCFLEDVATEFDIQGLEIDWSIVCWDADFRIVDKQWQHYKFSGTNWRKINSINAQNFLKNAYRVLLTRARQGMIIFIPKGDSDDYTRLPKFYDEIYAYLKKIITCEI